MRGALAALLLMTMPMAALAESAADRPLPAGRFKLDPSHASLIVKVLHLGVSWYALRFDRLAGDFTYDPAHPEATKLSASVETASLDAGPGAPASFADTFLAAGKFATATFTATALVPAPGGRSGTMTGDLTLMGVTRPVTFQVTLIGVGHGLLFGTLAGFSATTTLKRSDFGSKAFSSFVGDDVTLEFDGEFERH